MKLIEKSFYDDLKTCIDYLNLIDKLLTDYFSRYFSNHREIELQIDLSFIYLKYLEVLLKCYLLDKQDVINATEILQDFIQSSFFSIRKQNKGNNEIFSIIEEKKCISNIQKFSQSYDSLLPSSRGCQYLRYLKYKLYKMINLLYQNNFLISVKHQKKFSVYNCHLKMFCHSIAGFILNTDISLFELGYSHDRWSNLCKVSEVKIVKSFWRGKFYEKIFKTFINISLCSQYMTNQQHNGENNILKKIKLSYYGLYYFVQPAMANLDRKFFKINPNLSEYKMYNSF